MIERTLIYLFVGFFGFSLVGQLIAMGTPSKRPRKEREIEHLNNCFNLEEHIN